MSSDEVIELSIEETQALRAKLGLAPLRGVSSASNNSSGGINSNSNSNSNSVNNNNNSDEISLSIEETNALRVKIGLPPLKQSSTAQEDTKKRQGSSVSTAIHAPPTNTAAELEARSRIEDAMAKRDAKERIQRLEEENRKHNSGENESALNFASRMMKGSGGSNNNNNTEKDRKKKNMKKKGTIKTNAQLSIPTEEEEENNNEYSSADLQGIKVSHATSDFTAGSSTILTLVDKSILDVDPNSKKVRGFDANADEHELINVNMDDDTRALENLKRKRQIELGAGRAGGYAGYDDDEFEELGGVGVASSSLAGAAAARGSGGAMSHNNGKQKRGFAIGADGTAKSNNEKNNESNLFSTLSGGAVSLESRYGNTIASDFMSHDKDEMESKEEKLEKERAKQIKMLEKMRKKSKKKMKKDKKKKQRRVHSDDDESDNDQEDSRGGEMNADSSLMASLEATAVDVKSDGNGRKRRRHDDNEVDGDQKSDTTDTDEITAKKKKFELIMQKGKERTDKAFQNTTAKSSEMVDEEDAADDDAFLNAALAKARRLKRLKEMNGDTTSKTVKGEAVVINAVEKIKQEEAAATKDNGAETTKTVSGGGLTFEFDEMQEFTRALRAREDQAKRAAPVRSRGVKATASTNKKEIFVKKEEEIIDDTNAEPMVEDVDMKEMAQEMTDDGNNDDDDNHAAFGSTAENTGVGRGMAGFLSLLKQTGEIKNSGKEEMRGRAKDKRTYEDYDNLDLKKIVKIDTRNAQEKDIEFANREIKLEYRDDHGRLLTRKEAYRNMCYQFHGHGSSKKNEERRQKQIEREREEQKLASRQASGVGTLGALKATQKATGKAFIVHKT